MILAALIVALAWPLHIDGIRILGRKDPAPRCEQVDLRIHIFTQTSQRTALDMLIEETKRRKANTVRIYDSYKVDYDYPVRTVWHLKGRAYRCGTEGREEGK